MHIPMFDCVARKMAVLGFAVALSYLPAGAVELNTKNFPAEQDSKVQGVIISRDGQTLRLRDDDDLIGIIDLSNDTKIQLKRGMFGRKSSMNVTSLVPGLRIEAQGTGNEKGELVAKKVIFDPSSMKASRQIDTRVSPLESRTGTLEGRAGQLEGRAGQLETKTGQLEDQEKQTQQQAGQAKTAADQANQGVGDVNQRVTNLDNYQATDTATVYFKTGSSEISQQGKTDLDSLAQKALSQKGYLLEVAGFADTTGNMARNQVLSEKRANAVIQYLEQNGNIPIHRILTPAGMGTSHEAAANSSAQGRKLNRRVEVKILVNQGVVTTGATASAKPASTPSNNP